MSEVVLASAPRTRSPLSSYRRSRAQRCNPRQLSDPRNAETAKETLVAARLKLEARMVVSTLPARVDRGLLPLWTRTITAMLTSDRRSPTTNNVICLCPPDGPHLRVTGLGAKPSDIVQKIVPGARLPRRDLTRHCKDTNSHAKEDDGPHSVRHIKSRSSAPACETTLPLERILEAPLERREASSLAPQNRSKEASRRAS